MHTTYSAINAKLREVCHVRTGVSTSTASRPHTVQFECPRPRNITAEHFNIHVARSRVFELGFPAKSVHNALEQTNAARGPARVLRTGVPIFNAVVGDLSRQVLVVTSYGGDENRCPVTRCIWSIRSAFQTITGRQKLATVTTGR